MVTSLSDELRLMQMPVLKLFYTLVIFMRMVLIGIDVSANFQMKKLVDKLEKYINVIQDYRSK